MKKSIKNILNEIKWRISAPKTTSVENVRILKLRTEIASLPLLSVEPTASGATKAWIKNRIELRKNILSRDPRNFLQWEVVQKTMFHECKQTELEFLKKQTNWNILQRALVEDSAGNPRRFTNMPESSGNLIHHLYSVVQFLNTFPDTSLQSMSSAVEFGGGYGSMARLFYKLGFNGRYSIFDVPEFSALQEYFLSSLNLSVPIFRKPTKEQGIVILSDIEDFKKQCALDVVDLFIATWSISESPLELRTVILDAVQKSKYSLLAYQAQFQDINNTDYFKKYIKISGCDWKELPITHLPGQYYAFGSKK